MKIDKNSLPKQELGDLISSLELISARVFESVLTLSQTASSNTPEMQKLFQEWINCLGDEVINTASKDGSIDPEKLSEKIGVEPATIISLALTLHRQGRIKIKKLETEIGNSDNQEICDCLYS